MAHAECVVVGAGVVGLAVARALALAGREVVIVERGTAIGAGVSSRNSEVIHAGIHDSTGSLKATLCTRGKALLYAYGAERGVAHRRCGKLIVAAHTDDLPQLEALAARARANGVQDVALLSRRQAVALEPALACAGALWSPSSGIVDSHGLMTALLGDAENAGAVLALASGLSSAQREGRRWRLHTAGEEAFEMSADWLVNCGGLQARQVAARMDGFPPARVPALHLAKGHYFSLAARSPFSHLIYPLPGDGGLGVHLTLDLAGQARFGPDVEWLPVADPDAVDYRVDESRVPRFEAEIRAYWPDLPHGALRPAYSGVRPKLSGPGEAAADFHIAGPDDHGVPGVVQLFGIESPGLTASLAIAERVAAIVCRPG